METLSKLLQTQRFIIELIIFVCLNVNILTKQTILSFYIARFCDIISCIGVTMNIFGFENMSENECRLVNPQVLAFVGDGVHTLYVRNMLALSSKGKSGELHKITASYVKATEQSHVIDKIMPLLDETEKDIFRRARNYKTHSVAKNASVVDYRRATGFEAVIGYLYLAGKTEKLNKVLSLCVENENEN